MKKIVYTCLICLLMVGCAGQKYQMPKIDLPPKPIKPAIKAKIVPYQNDFLVGYNMPDALRLYEYLVEQDGYAEKLRYRIDAMNNLWVGK